MNVVSTPFILALLLQGTLAFAGEPSSALTSAELLARAADTELGPNATFPREIIAIARSAGFDYIKSVSAATKGDVKALSQLMRLTSAAELDGAYSESHAAVLLELLQIVGDAKFAAALRTESRTLRAEVGSEIRFASSLSPSAITKWYPRTSAAISRKK